jgi:aspartyl-tRNA synthetase
VLAAASPGLEDALPRFITDTKRTHSCGELTKADIGKEVVLFGWVNNRRDHGGAVFIDLRDREGITQVVFEEDVRPEVHELAGQLRLEFCVGLRGKVVSRGGNVNPKLRTGEIEVHATELEIFNRSEPTPFQIEDRVDTAEEKRLAYRFLDLRRAPLQKTLTSSTSSSTWWRASTSTSRSSAASATRTSASTASPSSPRSTWR